MAAPLPQQRLVALLTAERPSALCQRCLAQNLEATQADVRVAIGVALVTHAGIAIRRGACDRCRTIGAVAMLKA